MKGNAWQAVAQLQSDDTKNILAMASMAEDKQITKWIERRGNARHLAGIGTMVGDERVRVAIRGKFSSSSSGLKRRHGKSNSVTGTSANELIHLEFYKQ